MKYFTKVELEDITNSLLENPSYETLKELNNKYNGVENITAKDAELSNINVTPVVDPAPSVENNISTVDTPSIENMPSFEMPSNDSVTNTETENNFQNIDVLPNLEQNNIITDISMQPTNQNEEISSNVEIPMPAGLDIQNNDSGISNIPQVNDTNQNIVMPNTTESTDEMPNIENNNNNLNMNIPSFEMPSEASNDNIINSSVPNAFPSVNDIPQNNVNIPSFNIPSSGQETVEITGQAMENIDQSVPTFQPTDLNQMPNPENLNIISNGVMPTQNNNMAQETVPFDGNLWAPHNPDASSMMQPTENFNNQVTNNSIFANMNMPQNNPMPNNAPQYQQGPSMFSQIQNTYQ